MECTFGGFDPGTAPIALQRSTAAETIQPFRHPLKRVFNRRRLSFASLPRHMTVKSFALFKMDLFRGIIILCLFYPLQTQETILDFVVYRNTIWHKRVNARVN